MLLWIILFILTIGEGNCNPLQCSCLENPRDRGSWWVAVYGVAQSRTRLSDVPFTFHIHALEKEMATHSSVLAWRIPGTWEPGGLLSMGSHRVGHDWSDAAAKVGYSFSSKEQASFNFVAAVATCSDFGTQENQVSLCFHCFPIYLPWSDGTNAMILVFWMLSFKPTFSLSFFTFIKTLFSSSSLSA